MASTNPGNFANRDKEEVSDIASMGGKASHGGHKESGTETTSDEVAKGDRNPDGTFTKGSDAAKAAGHVGGMHSHDNDGLAKEEKVSELEVEDDVSKGDRNPDGTFTKGSAAAKEAGHKGGATTGST